MQLENIRFVLTDIEGTTTSISFVYDKLFPYFRSNIAKLKDLTQLDEVKKAFDEVIEIAKNEGKLISTTDEIIQQLEEWSLADKKITPLKTLQGVLWEEGYQSGEILGHVFDDVAPALEKWKLNGVDLGVFSSGSIAAQKLIFGYSEAGDLTPYFSAYFDTTTGGKREVETYHKIEKELKLEAEQILFLSDIREELESAKAAGFQTIQLVRTGTEKNWDATVSSFSEIEINEL
jgi:enolase-phosphatase E1